MIKVRLLFINPDDHFSVIPESVWATPLGEDLARIENIPIWSHGSGWETSSSFKDDIVVDVIERATVSCRGSYDAAGTEQEVQRRWAAICDHLGARDIQVEGILRGFFSLAVPVGMEEQRLRAIVAACPEAIELDCTCAGCGSYLGTHLECPRRQLRADGPSVSHRRGKKSRRLSRARNKGALRVADVSNPAPDSPRRQR